MRTHPPAACSASTPAYVVPGRMRIAERPRGERGVLGLHAAEQLHDVRASAQARGGEALGREAAAVDLAQAVGQHVVIVPSTTDGRPNGRPGDRPTRHTLLPLGLSHPERPRIVTPREQTRTHEDPTPTRRPAEPPPGGALRGPGPLAVVVRLRRARVSHRRVARRAHGRARPPEPGAGGVSRTTRGYTEGPRAVRRRDRRLLLSPGGAAGPTTQGRHGVALLQGGPWPRVLRPECRALSAWTIPRCAGCNEVITARSMTMRHPHTLSNHRTRPTSAVPAPGVAVPARAATAAVPAAAVPAPAVAPTARTAPVADAASADPAAGSRATCPAPTTPRSGSPDASPTPGSTPSTSPSTVRRSPSSARSPASTPTPTPPRRRAGSAASVPRRASSASRSPRRPRAATSAPSRGARGSATPPPCSPTSPSRS